MDAADEVRIGERIADRYQVERELGRGGMAIAYAVRDTVRGGTLALKRLSSAPRRAAEISQLFEREFHSLQQLSHPRVVKVYDFGHEASGRPYYTMEWLAGGDLRALSPLPYQQVCTLLCDVASALSLLHSRRMVHRDVTPRNVRCGDDGRAKLIDFGAIVPFGVARRLVGTPPFCAPESVLGQELDGRTDLFALGATAYFALTGYHAFPARTISAVQAMWRTPPPPPSSHCRGVPPSLDALVLSLLSLEPAARPATAAEVMERLAVIAELDLSEQLVVPQAYLTSPTLVGRDVELARVRGLVTHGKARDGGSVVVEAEEQLGRSRFLASCVLEAKLRGSIVARADATDAGSPFGVAMALAAQVVEAMPALADALSPAQRRLLPHDPAAPDRADQAGLADVSDEAGAGAGAGDVRALEPNARAQLQRALRDLMLRAAATRNLVLAVDDAHMIDERSAALLSLLSTEARHSGLVLIATMPLAEQDAVSASLRLFAEAASRVKLPPLSAGDTAALLRSVFGDVANLPALTRHLHHVAHGSPGALMQLAQHLLDRGLVRYEAGAWTLPAELDPSDLPNSVQATLEAKLDGLDTLCLELAQGLSLVAREGLSLDDLRVLSGCLDAGPVLSAIDRLVTLGIARTTGTSHRLADDAFRPLLATRISAAETRALHGRLAEVFAKRPEGGWSIARHLQLAGREQEACELILPGARARAELAPEQVAAVVLQLPAGWQTDVRALIDHCERSGRPPAEAHVLRSMLVGFAALTSQGEKADLEVLLTQLEHDCGHDIYLSLDPALPAGERLGEALRLAQERFDNAPPEQRVMAPAEALPSFARTIISAIGIMGPRYDHAFFAGLTALEPYVPLSPALQVVQWNVEGTRALASGHYQILLERNAAIMSAMDEPDRAGLDPVSHRYMGLALRYSTSLVRTMFGRAPDPQHLADMDGDPVFAISACHVRMLAALCAGDTAAARRHRKRAELIRLQDNPPQMFEGSYVHREYVVYAFAGDLANLKQLLPAIERRAASTPGWQPIHHHARGSYHELRGALPEALAEFECGLAKTAAGTHPSYTQLAAGRILALTRLGRAEEAREAGLQYLAAARSAQLGPQLYPLMQAMAQVHAALGAHDEARELADEVIALLEDFEAGGIVLGGAYETRARVALAAGDQIAFERDARACASIYRNGHNPMLAARYNALTALAEAKRIAVSAELANAAAVSIARVSELFAQTESSDRTGRAQTALRAVLDACGAQEGFVYTVQASGPVLAAQLGSCALPEGLDERVAALLDDEITGQTDDTATCEVSPGEAGVDAHVWRSHDGLEFRHLLLMHGTERGNEITGVAVVRAAAGMRMPPRALLEIISETLHKSGDVVTLLAEYYDHPRSTRGVT